MYVEKMKNIPFAVSEIFENSTYTYNRKKKYYYVKIGCGFDIETTTITDGVKPIAGYCYHWQMSFDRRVICGRSLEKMLEFFTAISEYLKDIEVKGKPVKLLVLVANLGYEWQYCKKYWYHLGITEFFCKEVRNPLTFTVGSNIEFREVIGLFGKSLDNIAKNYCTTQKLIGDLDFTKIRNSMTKMTYTEIKYCMNDVLILSELGNYIFNNFYGKKSAMPLTSTGFVRNAIKKDIGLKMSEVKEKVQSELPEESEYYAMRQYLFKGGLCGTNSEYVGEVLENVLCADLTSDYPAQMFHKDFPVGKCVSRETKMFNSVLRSRMPWIAVITFYDVVSTTTHSIYSYHKAINKKELKNNPAFCLIDNGRIYSAKKLTVMINDVELKGFMKAYNFDKKRVEIQALWTFESYGKLPSYVLKELKNQYRKKAEMKKAGLTDTQEYKDSKAFVNGIYGMCATAIFPYEKYLDGTPECNVIEEPNKKEFSEAIKNMYLSPFYAFWITSYARNLLIFLITRFPDLIIQYDTDSIYFRNDLPESEDLLDYLKRYNAKIQQLNQQIFNDEFFDDLGQWDIEKPILKFKGLGSKRYVKMQRNKMRFVVAGCREGTISKQFKKNVSRETFSGNIFEFFDDGMVIDSETSKKKESVYIDNYVEIEITDYQGNIQICQCPSSVCLHDIEFTLGMAQTHIDFVRTMRNRRKNIK